MKRRETSREEQELFERSFAETRPLKSETAKTHKAKPLPGAAIAQGGGGLDGRTSERLRRGLLEPEARLDLHGFTENAAHHALLVFLRGAQARGARLALVVTGKGAPKHAEEFGYSPRGVLKTAVPRWLKEPQFANLVAATRWSHVRHGGEGALYVYLRKAHR